MSGEATERRAGKVDQDKIINVTLQVYCLEG